MVICLVTLLSSVSGACAIEHSIEPDLDSTVENENTALIETIALAEKNMQRYGISNAPEKTEDAFRVTTYNIENLFDDVDDPTLSGRDEDIDDTKPEHQLIAVARAIHKLNSDVICLQEIESLDALMWFKDEYLADMGYDHVISLDAGNSRGIENAVLSRFPLSNPELWVGKELGGVHPEKYGSGKNFLAGEKVAFRRSPLKLDVNIPAMGDQDAWTLTLFVVHHKSGRYSQYWREAEAKMITKLASEVENEHPERAIMVLGDFNAQNTDESVKIYMKNGFHDIFTKSKSSGREIITHESNRRIDLILANQAANGYVVKDTAFVLGTASRPEGVDWRMMDTFEGYASDHYPVSVDLER